MAELPFEESFRDDLARLFALRRDVRRFKADPVPEATLLAALEQAHLAPSVGLSQPWRFVLVENPALRAAVTEEFQRANEDAAAVYDDEDAALYRALKLSGLKEAPIHLLVCSDTDPTQGKGLGRQTQPQTLRDSTVCAIQNLWLALRAVGLGMGWVSILEPRRLRTQLALPDRWEWVGYFCVGYPLLELDEPELQRAGWEKRRPLDDVLLRR